ncbi:regulator of G-protein signaling 7 isoform X3 [Globicephala melas]|uniref:regulator of G-protein signaling 7 isoform X3 n=1 Tax=Globicephala melas TaxID=9731 RepID=UPI00293D9DAF|nr:regulator of G-protein signaling 7 isoform X3 [Globicephala melas]
MAQGNNYGQTSNGVADESPNMLVYRKETFIQVQALQQRVPGPSLSQHCLTIRMEDVIARMQDEKNGIPIRTVKSFLSKIPSVFSVEALHLGTLMAAHGYFFPISDHVLTLKDDGTFYRFQTPYFWPSNCWEPENTDYAVYLCKRTMQNKARLELADYEAESLARLQRAFARKWEFIFMQAEAQAKVDKKRDKIERKILDSQERAFWDVHRPVPGCVNTTEVDIKKSSRMRNPHKTRKSVYGLQNDIRSHSPTHTPTPETKPPTEDELQQQIKYWQIQLDRHRLKMSKVADSLLSYTEQYVEYDPFLVPPDPSNPWLSDDTTFWELEASKEPSQQRVKRWGFGMDEALKDPVGREQFLKFLESEFSSENLRFWLAVEDLKKRPMREVPSRVQEIWQEFLAPGAPSAINLDSKSYDKTTQNVKEPGRYTFEDAQEHIYKLMKSDSYPRFIRSSAYQELLQAKKKFISGFQDKLGWCSSQEQTESDSSGSSPRIRGQEEANKICQKLKLIGPFGAIESTKKLTGTASRSL